MNLVLNNGKEIPNIGFGTWRFPNDETTPEIIKLAIDTGFRHFDTASSYENQVTIGKGINGSNIPREELFITGKLWNENRGYDNILEACKKTIADLNCEYLDLYLMHWPASKAVYENWEEINNETWRAMEYLYETGLVKAIGVCNFKESQLEPLIKNAKVKPMLNQIELHPGLNQKEIIEYCKQENIIIGAWSPFGSGKLLKKEAIKEIAEKYNKSAAQICLKWCMQKGAIPLPKSETKEMMLENLNLDDFEISETDMKIIDEMPFMGGFNFDSETITLFD